ncbi:60 kDa SS-A/Ro ribonucleoprotein [Phlyctochytrium bullatum]|nr:60 kDa SS-A/Ro ribonucleoprotein [Phlyctochytrium bullatum]
MTTHKREQKTLVFSSLSASVSGVTTSFDLTNAIRLTQHRESQNASASEDANAEGEDPVDDTVLNNAGGKCFALDHMKQLLRFLILGTRGGTFYVSERRLTFENLHCVVQLLEDGKGSEVVDLVLDVSLGGRAVQQDPGILVLAACMRLTNDPAVKEKAWKAIGKVCRTPTQLFMLVGFTTALGSAKLRKKFLHVVTPDGEDSNDTSSAKKQQVACGKGWGRGMRKAISEWYNGMPAEKLLYLATKYRRRGGWTHADLLSLAHVKPKSRGHDLVLRFLTHGLAATVADAQRDLAAHKVFKEPSPRYKPLPAVAAETAAEGEAAVAATAAEGEAAVAATATEGEAAAAAAITAEGEEEASKAEVNAADISDSSSGAIAVITDEISSAAPSEAAISWADDVAPPPVQERTEKKRWHATPKTYPLPDAASHHLGRTRYLLRKIEMHARVLGFQPDGANAAAPTTEAEKEAEALLVAKWIRTYRLAREHVPTWLLDSNVVWEALLEDMPLTAMLRNLGKMTSMGVLKPLGEGTRKVVEALGSFERLKKGRIHPLKVLLALSTYRSCAGVLGDLTWTPVQEISTALEKAFYLSFGVLDQPVSGGQRGEQQERGNAKPKRVMLALDVSGSMGCYKIAGTHLSCREASAAMAMAFCRMGSSASSSTPSTPTFQTSVMAFSNDFVPLDVTAADSLDDVLRKTSRLPFSGTDCSIPVKYALYQDIPVDAFIILTDNETWCGHVTASEMMVRYRREMGLPRSKMVVVGMVASGFSIADPEDQDMLDVVGFDANSLDVVRDFITQGF